MEIRGNTILITGGSSGIGLELAIQLRALGNTVIVTGRDPSKLDAVLQKSRGIHTLQSDVSDPLAIAHLHAEVTESFPALNVLINNAGIMRKVNFRTGAMDFGALQSELEVNLGGTIGMVAHFLPHLRAQSRAAIVNVSSGLAFVPLAVSPIYCATKAAIHSFTQSLRIQLDGTRISVFELAPPITDTSLFRRDFGATEFVPVRKMPVETLVKHAIAGLRRDHLEIRPGLSNGLKLMSRLAPAFILRQLNRGTAEVLAPQTAEQAGVVMSARARDHR